MGDSIKSVTLLDYGAGNVCSIRNAITSLGYSIIDVRSPSDISCASKLIFPGVGSFEAAVESLKSMGLWDALKQYLLDGKPYFGICLGMQLLFESSTECDHNNNNNNSCSPSSSSSSSSSSPTSSSSSSPSSSSSISGLCIIPGKVERFDPCHHYPIPHIGWNSFYYAKTSSPDPLSSRLSSTLFHNNNNDNNNNNTETDSIYYYFVHSYRVLATDNNRDWHYTITDYANDRFLSSIQKGNIFATQFHPEKSAKQGLALFKAFLEYNPNENIIDNGITKGPIKMNNTTTNNNNKLTKRIIACLDVRSNDDGDLVVTKGDQYDVREKPSSDIDKKGAVRNLGKPVELSHRYYQEGADEIVFLNITSFRNEPLGDSAMLSLLEETSKKVFVPLCIGGGIRDYTDSNGKYYSSIDVAAAYFRAGADKISIGSDAVIAAEEYYAREKKKLGNTAIEKISKIYGVQAVVVSIDPRRVYIKEGEEKNYPNYSVIKTNKLGPNGENYCWFQCTIKGGREGRNIDVVALSKAVEDLGAGELMINSIDADGTKQGYDIELINLVANAVTIPVIASSGAGKVEHFEQVFKNTNASAALAAGIFHRREVPIEAVKEYLKGKVQVRI